MRHLEPLAHSNRRADHKTCELCGYSIAPGRGNLDHIIPVKLGGLWADGKRPTHIKCNSRRGSDEGATWLGAHPDLTPTIKDGYVFPRGE